MKKLFLVLILIFSLSACSSDSGTSANDADVIRYYDMIELINSYSNFSTSSNYFDISGEISEIDGGYRYYIFIDNARVTMYDIEAIAIEKGVDYSNTMTANIGIFESDEYHMVPNQSDIDLGYVKGVSISGFTTTENPTLYVLVQWKNKNRDTTYREFFEIDL